MGWLTLLFIVFGIFVYVSLGHYLEASEREALARRVRQVADMVERYPPDWSLVGKEIKNHFAPEVNNRFTRLTVDGQVKYMAGAPLDHGFDPRLMPPAAATNPEGESFGRRSATDGTVLYVVALSKTWNGKRLVVEEGSAEAPTQEALPPCRKGYSLCAGLFQ